MRQGLDLDDGQARLGLVRDVVAMANSGGGRIIVGATADGAEVGIDDGQATALTAQALAGAIDPYLAPDRMEPIVRQRPVGDGLHVVEIEIPAAVEPPLVLSRAGTFETSSGKQRTVFAAQAVLVRRGGRVQVAKRDDYRRWTGEAVEQTRSRLVEQLTMVVEAPADAHLRLITDDRVLDEPSYLLERAVDIFRQRPERLLDGDDLRHLWLGRSTLVIGDGAAELLFQSALRKRATLFLWLTRLDLSPADIKRHLWTGVTMRDRDKSDAARSMLQVAALFLGAADYAELRAALAESSYAHMREAAAEWPSMPDAVVATEAMADDSLRTWSEAALHDAVDDLLSAGGTVVGRRAGPLGLELLRRSRSRTSA